MRLRQLTNPNWKLALGFGITTVVGLVGGVGGFFMESDTGIGIGIIGLVLALTGAITTPILWVTGNKQVKEMEALLSGHDLRAHWTFDADEWSRYTANEYARGIKETRTVALWTFVGLFVLMFVIEWFSDALTALTFLVALGIAGAFALFLGGVSYLMTRSNYARNQAGIGEVFIGGTCIRFGTRFYTWKGAWAELTGVKFDPGDPSVVEFTIRYGSSGNYSYSEVRIPVPRGHEDEAQGLVESY